MLRQRAVVAFWSVVVTPILVDMQREAHTGARSTGMASTSVLFLFPSSLSTLELLASRPNAVPAALFVFEPAVVRSPSTMRPTNGENLMSRIERENLQCLAQVLSVYGARVGGPTRALASSEPPPASPKALLPAFPR